MAAALKVPMNPESWGQSLSGAPVMDRDVGGLVPASIRRWQNIDASIDQIALDQHFVSFHLGGPKRLMRSGEGAPASRDVESGAYSVVPAGAAFQWQTIGPVDFVHFYFDPKTVNHVIASAFDRDPAYVHLQESLGDVDPMASSLALNLLEELAGDDFQQAYLDDMLHLLLCRVLRLHSNARHSSPLARHVLAPYRLRRALDFIEANLGNPIGVEDIAAASGLSQFHFSRAFRQTVGQAPYAHLLERRIGAAKALLLNSDRSLTAIAGHCGFTSLSQFSRMFKRDMGASPSDFRDRQ